MLIGIIVALCWLLGILAMLLDGVFDWVERIIFALIGGVLLGGIVATAVFVGLEYVVSRPMDKHYITEQKSLVALQDGNQTTGSFFLGSGYIDGEPTYTYYRNEGGGYKLENAKADTVIVFQDATKPYLVRQTDCKTSMTWLAECVTDGRVTEIHVPKGTIKQNYVLDAK